MINKSLYLGAFSIFAYFSEIFIKILTNGNNNSIIYMKVKESQTLGDCEYVKY